MGSHIGTMRGLGQTVCSWGIVPCMCRGRGQRPRAAVPAPGWPCVQCMAWNWRRRKCCMEAVLPESLLSLAVLLWESLCCCPVCRENLIYRPCICRAMNCPSPAPPCLCSGACPQVASGDCGPGPPVFWTLVRARQCMDAALVGPEQGRASSWGLVGLPSSHIGAGDGIRAAHQ
jgi:hypothetical protein